MNQIIKWVLTVFGWKALLGTVWGFVKPRLDEWAKSDGIDDWDDDLVKFLDYMITKIIESKHE